METILVAGGAGYIGSHVCKALAQAGIRPVVYDNLSHGHEWAVRWGPLEVGDLHDAERLDGVLRKHQPSAVIHLAAFIAAGESVADPAGYYVNNVGGTLSLLDCMRRAGVDALVFSSTTAVYGAPDHTPINERTLIRPVSPYGHSKAFCEQAMRDYAGAFGLRSVALRYFNAAGADPDAEVGEAHEPETHLIPIVLEVAARRRSHLDIYGDDYPTPDGTCIRDYVHVADLAQAHVLALDRIDRASEPTAEAYNLGNGSGFSVLDVVRTAERVTDRQVATRRCPRRAGDPPELLADSSMARSVLGWQPRYGTLEQQIGDAWRWLNEHDDRAETENSTDASRSTEAANETLG